MGKEKTAKVDKTVKPKEKTTKNTKQATADTNEKEQKGPNKLTTEAGIIFNVNTVKAKAKDYFATHNYKKLMFSGGQVALATSIETLYKYLLNEVCKHAEKDTSGCKNVSRKTLRYTVLMNPNLEQYFAIKLKYFNKEHTYQDNLPVSRKDLDSVRESVDKQLNLNDKAHNLMCYFLHTFYLDIARTAHKLVVYSNRKTFDGRCVLSAVDIRLTGQVVSELETSIRAAMKAVGDEIKETEETEKDKTESDEGSEEGKTAKGKAKGAGKKATKVENDEEGSEEGDEESEEDEEESEEEENEEEVKPKAQKKGAVKKNTK